MDVSNFAISAGCTDREGLMQALGLQHASEKCEALGPEKPSLAVKPRLNTLPLTVFYGGQVSVYNNVSSETVQAIMAIAAKGNWLSQVTLTDAMHINPDSFFSQARATAGNFHCDVQTKDPITFPITQTSCVCTSNVPSYYPAINTIIANSTEPMVPEALPLARKASLIRFLEKRKERKIFLVS
ncbi:hypothetical protein KP509_28G066300 [Ceratopteris richardii]|uniref:Tify domain-containing protein n=1 Tax=Ceratopteris richardii TaxID=49495 RepID=A0A8T2REC4_CERRI|nr:hypothetical protein KP509_28G066300 [Ceratopteris richardii]